MHKLKKIIKSVRVIIFLVFLVLAILTIHPSFKSEGVAIRNVVTNSSASLAGIEKPMKTASPMNREKIISIDSKKIVTMLDYETIVKVLKPDQEVLVKTNKKSYKLKIKPIVNVTVLGETELVEVPKMTTVVETVNGTSVTKTIPEVKKITEVINHTKYIFGTNESYIEQEVVEKEVPVTELKEVNKTLTEIIGTEDIGLTVYQAPTSNIRKGLDLQGGTRVLLTPAKEISPEDMEILLANLDQRLNVYGISDVSIKDASDLSGNQYVVVEIAGANEDEVKELLAKQGKFDAKIGNETVFRGGTDVNFVCRSSDCAGIDPTQGCGKNGDMWYCRFMFSISISPEAAKKQADITGKLSIVPSESTDRYLNQTIDFYLDDQQVDSLNIGESLKGKPSTDIAISGSGSGISRQEAIFNSLENMKRLQTILITGSLPVKLNIVKTDSISPVLGKEFVKNAITIAIFSLVAVVIIIMIRYRKPIIATPMIIMMFSEIVLLMGVAALIGWNLDLAAIAGIIITIGTAVNDQVIITDETLRGERAQYHNWKDKIKNAFFIIMSAYFTLLVSMIPLLFAGAGLLKGFALTTIIGLSVGVFITRPAYAAIVEILLKE